MARASAETKLRAVQKVLDDRRTATAVADELGLVASTVRRWVRQEWQRRREDWWAAQVTPVFGFLTDVGFVLTDVRGADFWTISAVYRAERVAVLVEYSEEFRRVEVKLMRAALLDLPDRERDRVYVSGVPGLRGHLADALLIRPYPNRKQHRKLIRRYSGLALDRVAEALAFWAWVLQEHAGDLLRGDTSIFDEWERGRAARVVTVHVPRAATARQEADAVARTRAVLPDADLVVKRYPIPREEVDALLTLHNGSAAEAG